MGSSARHTDVKRIEAAATVLAALIAGLGTASCTSEEPDAGKHETESANPTSDSTAAQDEGPARRPTALVFLSGRIAYPNVTLTTWSRCPFRVIRIRPVDAETVEVIGTERKRCDPRVNRQLATARIDQDLVGTFKRGATLVVTSLAPTYSIEASLRLGLA